jgi:hypothetical protein
MVRFVHPVRRPANETARRARRGFLTLINWAADLAGLLDFS